MPQKRIKRSRIPTSGAHIRQSAGPDDLLRFSFKLFDTDDCEMCPPRFQDGYTQTLMQRLRDLSTWTVSKFVSRPEKAVRNHTHDWQNTSRPNGFAHLQEQLQSYPGWQFCLTANAHGRVHGIIIDNTFYVIWLDCDHKLYAEQG